MQPEKERSWRGRGSWGVDCLEEEKMHRCGNLWHKPNLDQSRSARACDFGQGRGWLAVLAGSCARDWLPFTSPVSVAQRPYLIEPVRAVSGGAGVENSGTKIFPVLLHRASPSPSPDGMGWDGGFLTSKHFKQRQRNKSSTLFYFYFYFTILWHPTLLR